MKYLALIVVLGFSQGYIHAQKVKYKDLYPLLESGQYDQAEPFLRQFLSDDKNAEHANANLQMALLFHKKIDNANVLKDSSTVVHHIDSAILYYNKAQKYIDEKEVKKNDEYYRAYQRRDIRTGKFGIKLADIQFDIEKKVESLQTKKRQLGTLKSYYNNTLKFYNKAQTLFRALKSEYVTQKRLLLQSNASTSSRLAGVKEQFQLAVENFEAFKGMLEQMEKPGHSADLKFKEILDFAKDGDSHTDLMSAQVVFWDYGQWADRVLSTINKEVIPLREELIAYDKHLNNLLNRVKEGAGSLNDEIKPAGRLFTTLSNLDKTALPALLLSYKLQEIQYRSRMVKHTNYLDSADILYQMSVVMDNVQDLKVMDSLGNLMKEKDIDIAAKNYQSFVESQYRSESNLTDYITAQSEFARVSLNHDEKLLNELTERSRWLIYKADSLPLYEAPRNEYGKYVPLYTDELTTAGLYFSGETPAQGYLASINNARVPDLKVDFKVDKKSFNKSSIGSVETQVAADREGGLYYVLYSVPKPEQTSYAGSVVKIYATDGAAWAKDLVLDARPDSLIIENQTGNLLITYDENSYNGQGTVPNLIVLDKQGQVIKR